MKNLTSLKKISLILLVIILLPALFYSGYEVSSLSTSEELFGRMYQQQLDVVLFSLNQYAFDAVSGWAAALQNILAERPSPSRPGTDAVRRFIEQHGSLLSVIVCDSSLKRAVSVRSPLHPASSSGSDEKTILRLLAHNGEKIGRLLDFHRVGYRKIEPVPFADPSSGDSLVVLVFVVRDYFSAAKVVGVVLDERVFVQEVLSRKLDEAAGTEFLLAVMVKRSQDVVYSTSAVQPSDLKQTKQLWLFPQYNLGIRLKGETIDELVQSRFHRNILFVIGLDIVLLTGAWLVYRTIQREMELVRLKSDFVSNVSHELRTPLSLIRMFAETLEMKRVKTEKKKFEYYRTILQETERLTRLVNNILNFSRMEAGRRQYHFQRVDINTVVKNVLEVYEYQLHSKGFQPKVTLRNALPPVSGDDEAIAEAVHNIVDNAIKYSGEEKFIAVQTGMRDGVVFVEVQDRGIGIPSEHHAKIFEKFFRVSDGLVHSAKGSGLGLSLVQHIMDAHHGTIEVESEPGKGSIFRLLFKTAKI